MMISSPSNAYLYCMNCLVLQAAIVRLKATDLLSTLGRNIFSDRLMYMPDASKSVVDIQRTCLLII